MCLGLLGMERYTFLTFCLIGLATSQEIVPTGSVSITEGDEFMFNCTGNGTNKQEISPQINGRNINSSLVDSEQIPNGAAFTFGPITKVYDGGRLRCDFFSLPQGSRYTAEILLRVTNSADFSYGTPLGTILPIILSMQVFFS